MEYHNIEPVYDNDSKVLILGSFPSVKSREQQFFYGHPSNRFWRVMSIVTGQELPKTIDEKRDFLLKSHIAVWDVIKSCDIVGSGDSSIKNVVANDISAILNTAEISRIFCNGKTSYKLYHKLIEPYTGVEAIALPSTSPANAQFSVQRLVSEWNIIKDFL